VLAFFSPAEMFPTLAKYHIQQFILLPALAAAFASMATRAAGLQSPQYILMLGLWFAVVMSNLSATWFHGALNAFTAFGVPVAYYFLVSTSGFTLRRIRILCMTICLSALGLLALAIRDYHSGASTPLVLFRDLGGGVIKRRIMGWGFLADPNDFAQFLLLAICFLGLFWRKNFFLANIVRLFIPAAVLIYGIYLTESRGAIIGIVAVAFALLTHRIGKAAAGVVAGLLFMLLLALQFGGGRAVSMNEGSATGRIFAWGAGIGQLKSDPVFGSGFGLFTESNDLTAHNSFVLCFAELGMFGYFFWLALIVSCVWGLELMTRLPIKTEEDADFQRVVTAMRSGLYAFLATGWFLSRTYTVTLYVLLAMAAALIQMRKVTYPGIQIPPSRWIPRTVAFQVGSVMLFYVIVRLRGLS
jgi:hypothetical protein